MSVPETALILAAGFGTRLRPITNETPKALVEIGGRPMIEYPIRMLAAAGVQRFVINLHHLGDLIRNTLGDGRRFGVRIDYSPESSILETGGAIRHARPLLGTEQFIVANCDALIDVNVPALCEMHRQKNALATLVVRKDPDAHRYGPLDLDRTGRIRRFLGHPKEIETALETFMFCGVHVLSTEIFDWMPPEEVFSITQDVYARAHRANRPLFGFQHKGYWRDPGTLESLAATRQDIETGRFQPSFVTPL
jgi:NDP-sugar pyrophosphorylase family protein